MNRRNLLIFAAVLLALYLFLHGRKRPAPVVTYEAPEKLDRAPVSERNPRLEELEKKMGLKTGKVKADADAVYLDVVVSPLRRCGPGDLDIILLDAKHRKDDRLLLSVEPITGGGFREAIPLKGTRLESGFHHEFRIPRKGEMQSYALYLCSDASKSGSCGSKRVVDPNRFFEAYYAKPDPPVEPESVFFYQMVNFHDDTLAVFAKGVPDPETYRLLPTYLAYSLGADADKAAKVVKTNTKAVGSLPVELGLATRIDLPLHDSIRCGRGH